MVADDLLDAARGGNEQAFRALVEPLRRELHAHCYRMLGSVDDADDALRETLLRAWRGIGRFEGRSSLRLWLHRIVTNTCLNHVERRPAAPDAYPDDDVPGAEDDGPAERYERRESLELAFVVALRELPPRQRAALILRDVLSFSARESAGALATTPVAVNSALQHARARLAERLPERSQQATLRALGDERLRAIVAGYSQALERGDVDSLLALLTADAAWTMPPDPEPVQGIAAIRPWLVSGPFTVRWRHLPARANGQAAVGCYAWDAAAGEFRAYALDVLTLRGPRIERVTAFIDARAVTRCGLPAALPA
jgi:RNA polymerase sigma-70 factor, ECF subfamily